MLKENNIISTFVIVDDFFKTVGQHQVLLQGTQGERGPACSMANSEIATICLLFEFPNF